MAYKGIVFDKDGTLIDFNSTWLPIYQFAAMECAQNNRDIADELLATHGFDHATQKFTGGSLLAAGNNRDIASAWAELLPDIVDSEKLDALYARLSQIFQQKGAILATPVPGLNATIKELKNSGFKIGVATSDSFKGIHNTLQAFDVIPEFDFLCGYDSGHGVKPGPGMVLAFSEAVSLPTHEIVVVGDNCHDIEMGRNADAGLCVGVLTGTSTRVELEGIADIVLDDIRGLPDIVN